MTKEEALKILSRGEKVTHRYFSDDEFIEQKGGFYYDEKKYQINPESFWHYRRNATWEDGWSIYQQSPEIN